MANEDVLAAQRILGITPDVQLAPATDPLANIVPNFETMPIGATPTPESIVTEPSIQQQIDANAAMGGEVPATTVDDGGFVVNPTINQQANAMAGTPPLLQQPVADEYTDEQAAADIAAEDLANRATAIPEPTPQQQAQADAAIHAPVQQEVAAHRAAEAAQKDIAAEQLRIADELEKRRNDAIVDASKTIDEVRFRSLPEIFQRGSFGDKLGASIALLMGGVSQGLTGAKTNPVLDFIDTQVARQDAKDKLTGEQKIALRKILIDEAQVKMQALENASQDQFRKGSLANARQQLKIESDKARFEMIAKAEEKLAKESSAAAQVNAENGQAIQDVSKLSKEQMDRLVTMPDGSKRLIDNPKNIVPLTTMRGDYEPGLAGIDRILTLTKDFNRITDLKKRAQIATELKAVAGQLRIPFTGPGAMTEKEYERLINTLGDPTALAAFPVLERAKLLTVKGKLEKDMASGFKRFGLTLPQSRQQQLIDNLKAKGYSESAINKVLGNQ